MKRANLSLCFHLFGVILAVAWLGHALPVRAQPEGGATERISTRDLSRQMRIAIRLYEQGSDTQAMDRFMDVLVNGSPAERPMANEYLNLITQRQNVSGAGFLTPPSAMPKPEYPKARPAASPAGEEEGFSPTRGEVVAEPERRQSRPSSERRAVVAEPQKPEERPTPRGGGVVAEPEGPENQAAESERAREPAPRRESRTLSAEPNLEPEPSRAASAMRAPPPSREAEAERDLPQSRKSLMKKEIETSVRNRTRHYLGELEKLEDVRIIMADGRNPRAIGVPVDYLFDSGIVFKKTAAVVLKNVTGLIYALGATQVAILPEGIMIGDSKVLDMRRTMGISSYLYAAGVAPPRVRVNLLQSQVDLPRGLADFKGIVLLFIYNQPLTLTAEKLIGEEAGPPISLGVFPDKLNVERNEGVVIEFSVVEPPAGLSSWKFQLLQPGRQAGKDLQPLQEVAGSAPVFHQVYWNGRKNYFGATLPPGSYEAVLTATDSRHRSKTLHQWITLGGSAGTAATQAPAAMKAPIQAVPAPSAVPEKILAQRSVRAGSAASSAVSAKKPSRVASAAPPDELPGMNPPRKPPYVQIAPRKRIGAGTAKGVQTPKRSEKSQHGKPALKASKPSSTAVREAKQLKLAKKKPVPKKAIKAKPKVAPKPVVNIRSESEAQAPAQPSRPARQPQTSAQKQQGLSASRQANPPVRTAASVPTNPAAAVNPGGGPGAMRAPAAPATPSQPTSAAQSSAGGAVNYKIAFMENAQTMTQEGDRRLALVAETMSYYPFQNLNLIGYASPRETDAEVLAQNRAKLVSSLLVNKYNVDSRRIQIQSKVADSGLHEVEIYIVAGKE